MYIPRTLETIIKKRLFDSNKIIIVYGPRQAGKTTLIKKLLQDLPFRVLYINADEKKYIDYLSSRDRAKLALLVEGYDLLFLDEAQRVPDIGINLKILHDAFPGLKVIATGSSSLELADKTREALTGRTWSFRLYPIAFDELRSIENTAELISRREEFLLYGMYPEVFSWKNHQDKISYLRELTTSYLFKDIFTLTSIKHANKLDDLLRLLAFQVGSLVSFSELGSQLGLSKETVASYIELLEKTFVIFRLRGFSRNLRKEIVKNSKYYFFDLGIRNALIENFKPLRFRNDLGQLWENFIISERIKYLNNHRHFKRAYFWRTYSGTEIDYVEESNGDLMGVEIKWSARDVKSPRSWKKAYPAAEFKLINTENFHDFISSPLF